MELSRSDLLRLLSVLEGELEAREMVIAVLKTEQVKRLLYPCRNSSDGSRTTTIIPKNKIGSFGPTGQDAGLGLFTDGGKNILSPFSALLRDSFAAFDPTFDETSVKNVFIVQQKNLESLIYKQNRIRTYLKTQLNEIASKHNALFQELEIEKQKNIDFKRDETLKEVNDLQFKKMELEHEIENIKTQFKFERERERTMIVCLLAERKQLIVRLIEEKQKNSEIVDEYNSEKNKNAYMVEGLEEETQKSLKMELDLQKLSGECDAKNESLKVKLRNSEIKSVELTAELEKLRNELEIMNKSSSMNSTKDLGEGIRSAIVTMNLSSAVHGAPSTSTKETICPPSACMATSITPGKATPSTTDSIKVAKDNVVVANSPYATVQPCKTPTPIVSSLEGAQTCKSSKAINKSTPMKTTGCNLKTNPGKNAFQNMTYSSNTIESPVPPLPATNPPSIPQGPRSVPIVGTRNNSSNSTPQQSICKKPPGLPNSHPIRGAPPPVPPNKPVLPPQAFKEKTKELQSSAVSRAKLVSAIIPGFATQPTKPLAAPEDKSGSGATN